MTNQKVQTHEYDLSKISVPVAIYYTQMDYLAHVDDVSYLANKLPNLLKQKLVQNMTNNMDLLYGNNVNNLNRDIIETLDKNRQ